MAHSDVKAHHTAGRPQTTRRSPPGRAGLRHLSGRKAIDYRDLSIQQLGSIYERLLELELVRGTQGRAHRGAEGGGMRRKRGAKPRFQGLPRPGLSPRTLIRGLPRLAAPERRSSCGYS
jgi:hypothetical protein